MNYIKDLLNHELNFCELNNIPNQKINQNWIRTKKVSINNKRDFYNNIEDETWKYCLRIHQLIFEN
jgi:hypothetical protein